MTKKCMFDEQERCDRKMGGGSATLEQLVVALQQMLHPPTSLVSTQSPRFITLQGRLVFNNDPANPTP